jgi:pathogenesis-related protein 1
VGPEPGLLAGITAEHNAARARAATSMPLPTLSWSPEIAVVAQAYAKKLADGCANELSHSSPSERHDWGENLAAFSITGGKGDEPNGSARDTVLLWESEVECYTFGPFQSGVNATCSEACRAYGGCGHLTQMLWRNTQRVGCGQAECSEGKTRKSYWVCNYDPPGNYTGELPY